MHKRILRLTALAAGIAIGLLGGAPGLVRDAAAKVSSTNNTVSYVGNGVTTAFVTTFTFQVNTDLAVTVAGLPKSLGPDFTVSGAGNSSGTVTFTTAPANGAAVVITRVVDYLQKTSLRTNRTYDPASIENALDKLAMGEHQLSTQIQNPVSPSTVTNTTPVTATNSVTARQLKDWFADITHVKAFGAVCDGVVNDTAAVAAAIAALPSTGGVVDARSCTGGIKLGSTLTIAKNGTTLLLPAAAISLGANQVVVSPGTHNVSLVGSVPYGNSASRSVAGTNLVYTGTGVALKVGDSTADTYGFTLRDATVDLEAAGSAATGIQLNRSIQFLLTRPRIHGLTTTNTQVAIDLEGFGNFTGGKVEDYYIWNGMTGVLLGKNANANWFVGGIQVNNNSGGTCFNVAGDVTGNADGNIWLGGDCENTSGTVFRFDFASRNQVFGIRTEPPTSTLANATANSLTNSVISAGSVTTITDLGNTNSFLLPARYAFSGNKWNLNNATDTTSTLTLRSGTSASQNTIVEFLNHTAARQWYWLKDASENLILRRGSNDKNRLVFTQAGNTQVDTETGGTLQLCSNANSCTGGVAVFDGAASPAKVVNLDSKTRGTITLAAGTGTATVTTGVSCTCTDQTAAAAVKCAVSATTLTATGTGTDVITYHCM